PRNAHPFAVRIVEQLVSVNHQDPVALTMSAKYRLEPGRAKVRLVERQRRPPQIDIGLFREIFGAAIGGAIIHGKERSDPFLAVILQEEGQAMAFIAENRATKQLIVRKADLMLRNLHQLIMAKRRVKPMWTGGHRVHESFV